MQQKLQSSFSRQSPLFQVHGIIDDTCSNEICCHDLDLWPMTLIFKLNLDMLRLDLYAKIQYCMSVHSARIVRRTDGHTDTQTHRHTMSKLLHPIADAGCKNDSLQNTILKFIIICDRDRRLEIFSFIFSRKSENFDRWTTSVGQVVPEIPHPPSTFSHWIYTNLTDHLSQP